MHRLPFLSLRTGRGRAIDRTAIVCFAVAFFVILSGRPLRAQNVQSPVAPQVHVGVSQPPAPPEDNASALAAKLQNPIADLISVPFQNNTNFNVGPQKGTQDILNIQPVIPIHVTQDWNVITRTIVPLTWSPSFQPAASVPPFGVGASSFSAFLSPTNTIDGWTWGAGPIIGLPTSTNKNLGSNVWGAGPAIVAVTNGTSLGIRAAGQQRVLVRWDHRPKWQRLQHHDNQPVPELQLWWRLVHRSIADHDRKLGYRRGEMDASHRRTIWPPNKARRQTTGEPARRCLLQRAQAIRCRHLAVAHADSFHILVRIRSKAVGAE